MKFLYSMITKSLQKFIFAFEWEWEIDDDIGIWSMLGIDLNCEIFAR